MEKKSEQVRAGEKQGLGLAAGLAANAAQVNQQAATREVVQGMEKVFAPLARSQNPNSFGNLFEAIEATKFNRDAALKMSNLRAEVTAKPIYSNAPPAPNDPRVDIRILGDKGNVVQEVQSKAGENAKRLANEQFAEKYEGLLRLVPKDKQKEAREWLERQIERGDINRERFRETLEKLAGELQHGDVTSGGTALWEAKLAKQFPDFYKFFRETKAIGSEAARGAAVATATSGVISLAISGVRNSFACHRGDMSGEEALAETAKEGAKGALRGGAVGGGGALIRGTAEVVVTRGGGQLAKALTKSNIATTIAAASVETGVIIYDFIRGEIEMAEAAECLGQNTIATAGSFYMGVVAVAAAPAGIAVGAAIAGSVAGYMLTSYAYQTCMAIKHNAELAEAEAARLEALVGETVMEREKAIKLMEETFSQYLHERRQQFTAAITAVVQASDAQDHDAFCAAMTEFTVFSGKELKLESFAEFDDFMMDSDEPLRI